MMRTLWVVVGMLLCWQLLQGAGCTCMPGPSESPNEQSTQERNLGERPPEGLESPSEGFPRPENTEPRPEFILPEGNNLSFSAACGAIGQFTCTQVFDCCKDRGLQFADQAACIKAFRENCEQAPNAEAIKAALQQGTATLDQASLTTCLQAIRSAGQQCTSPGAPSDIEACNRIFQAVAGDGQNCPDTLDGLRCAGGEGICFPTPVGTPCKRWSQDGTPCREAPCAPGLFCFQGEQPATCRSPFAQDQACTASAQCQPGLTCLENKCQPQLAEGADCNAVAQCGQGLACDPATRKCVKQKARDETCDFSQHCQQDLYCDGVSVTGTICKLPFTEGGTCTNSRDCGRDLKCDQQRCAPLPGAGETCDPRDNPGCKAPLLCDSGTSRCVALPELDQPCLSGQERCAKDLTCLTTPQGERCRPKRKEGESCPEDLACIKGLSCVEGTCRPAPAIGDACHDGYLCQIGAYCDLMAQRCTLLRAEGEPCDIGNECPSTLTCLPDSTGQKRCAPLPQVGQPCRLRCAASLRCRPGQPQGRCQPLVCRGLLTP